MEGIYILNKTPVLVRPDWWVIGVIVSILLLVVFVAMTFIFAEIDSDGLSALFIGLSFCAFISIFACCSVEVPNTDGRYRYEVVIDENVPLKDIYEKYNIIEQNGKKWVIEDKEKEE